jgi:1-acyl-sn-glycerol-3-phosphate acyltransferase
MDSGSSSGLDKTLLDLIRKLLHEIQPQKRFGLSLESRLDRDLALDSLSRAELLMRIEQTFRTRLPEKTLGDAETVGDLLKALSASAAVSGVASPPERRAEALPPVSAADAAATLTEALDWHASHHPDRPHLTYLEDAVEPVTLTYGELSRAARQVAAGLLARNISRGDRVALMLPTGIDFFVSFFGVLHAGAVPVPIYPPARLAQLEEHVRRQSGILRNCGARLLITTERGKTLAASIKPHVPSMEDTVSVADLTSGASALRLPSADARDTALLQYTSGSTGDPKGVVLTHANLLANIRAMGAAMNGSSSDIFVSWLPLYHDMGLIGAWLGSLYFGTRLYIMSPLTFLAHPESWLWAIHRYRATLSAAPNFAFEMCANKIQDEDIRGLDLSSLRMVANGAEPVSAASIRHFTDRFAAYGFRREAMAPAFGLAENAVGLTFPPLDRGPLIDRVDRHVLSRDGIARSAAGNDPNPLELVGCGRALPGHQVRIVDDAGHEVAERVAGRLEFRGPSATSGYFQNEQKTRELFRDGWVDTGDQAYLAGGELFITGRIKDIVIRAGQHYYPQELEEPISQLPSVVKNGVVLFGTSDQSTGTERIVVAVEAVTEDEQSLALLRQQIRELSASILGQPVDDIVIGGPDTIPRTENGKVRRSAAKALYESGTLGAPRRSLSQQRFRIGLNALAAFLVNQVRSLAALVYAGWWWVVVAAAAAGAWFAVMLLPGLKWRWSAVRNICRFALVLVGAPCRVETGEALARRDAVLAVNHSSYADALVLAAAVPGEPLYAAKRELADQIFAGSFLRRLGVIFLERHDVAASIADAERMGALARQGRLLVVFPEGTFTGRAGLLPFRLGAFKVACEAGLPVIPATIKGTRRMLRGDQWWPRWSPLTITIGAPIGPDGADFSAALRLRDHVRAAILAHDDEPDLPDSPEPIEDI